jgi:hypothetical protein
VILYQWCIFIVVGFGMLVVAARSASAHPALSRFLFFGFAFFALTHLLGLFWLLKQWTAAAAALQKIELLKLGGTDVKVDLQPVLDAPAAEWVLPFHLAFDVFVLTGIWWLTRKRGL